MISSDICKYLMSCGFEVPPMGIMGITVYSPLHMTSCIICITFNKIDNMYSFV